MLETVLEQLLLRFLAPYLGGLSKDKLHLGVFSGSLELKGLTVKEDALALLGNPTLRVTRGVVGRLHLHVPWTHLHSGKLRVSVETIHFEVERIGEHGQESPPSDEELVGQLRAAKKKAIALRATQLKDLVRRLDEEDEEEDISGDDAPGKANRAQKQGVVAKLVRKIINNVHVALSDVKATYCSPNFGLACGVQLGGINVVSTGSDFRPPADELGEEVVIPDGNLYKLVHLQGLSLRMAPVGVSKLTESAAYVLHPVSARLRFAHEPSRGFLRTEFEVAQDEMLQLSVVRSQVKHLRSAQAGRGRENMRLHRLMVPEKEEHSLYADANRNLLEYSSLYERQELFKLGLQDDCDDPLSPVEEKRLQLLEDALAIGLLARRQARVHQRLDEVREEHDDLAQKSGTTPKEEASQMSKDSNTIFSPIVRFFGRFGRGKATEEKSPANIKDSDESYGLRNLGLTEAEHDKWSKALNDDSKFEKVDMPRKMRFEFRLGLCAVDLVDDRWSNQHQRQVLSLALEEAHAAFNFNSATDYHGRDSAEWRLELNIGTFHAFQSSHIAFRFCPAPRTTSSNNSKLLSRSRALNEDLKGVEAARLVVASELGEEENVLALYFKFAPTEFFMPQGLIEEIREFIRADLPPGCEMPTAPAASQPAQVRPSAHISAIATFRRSVSEIDQEEGREKVAEMMFGAMPTAVGSRTRARSLAHKVYERIPDKMTLDVTIASPIFHVPVPSKGTTKFSLGELKVHTATPCETSNLDIRCELTDMVLCAITDRGERFNMFKPVLFEVRVRYQNNDDGNSVIIDVFSEKPAMTLVPQSLQMLMATPFAMAGVLWAKESKKTDEVKIRPVPPSLDGASDQEEEEEEEEIDEEEEGEDIDVPDGDQDLDEDDEDDRLTETQGLEEETPHTDVVLDEAPAPPLRQFIFSCSVQFNDLELTLSDSVVPVMVIHMNWTPPGLVIHRQRLPHVLMTVEMAFSLEVDILNPRSDSWEPFIERFHGGVVYERDTPADMRKTKIMISAQDELLVNLKPTMLQRFLWFFPLFMRGLTFQEELVVTSTDAATADVSKYRVMNLSDQNLEIEFKSGRSSAIQGDSMNPLLWDTTVNQAGRQTLRKTMRTTIGKIGAEWEELDKWVGAPYFATGLVVRLPGEEQWSETLSLEHDGAVVIPNCGLIAQILTPSPDDKVQHKLLLFTSTLRIHNQSCLPLLIRFHSSDGEVIHEELPEHMSCPGEYLGFFRPTNSCNDLSYRGNEALDGRPANAYLLMPNGFAVVPSTAMYLDKNSDMGLSICSISCRPALANIAFSNPGSAGSSEQAKSLRCRRTRFSESKPGSPVNLNGDHEPMGTTRGKDGIIRLPDICLITQTEEELVSFPRPLQISTIVIKPPLIMMNALPFGDLLMEYNCVADAIEPAKKNLEACVPNMMQLAIYGFPGNLSSDSVSFRVRLGKAAAWSTEVIMGQGKDIGVSKKMNVCGSKNGAFAALLADSLDAYRIRFSCPFWLIDRTGFPDTDKFRVVREGRSLPHRNGLYLLPDRCLEEECGISIQSEPIQADCQTDFVWCGCSKAGPRYDVVRQALVHRTRIPPNFSLMSLMSEGAPHIMCMQTEDVNREDMLGAECQAVTIRPRIMITNASEFKIEIVREGTKAIIPIQAHESVPLHFAVPPGEEDNITTNIMFRPVCRPPCRWSGALICSDVAAGSKAFILRAAPASETRKTFNTNTALGLGVPIVWSAEIAPIRGALSITLKDGSTFAAVNRSKTYNFTIKPTEHEKVMGEFFVPQVGDNKEEPVPFGWANPFLPGGQAHSLRACVNNKDVRIDDVRRWSRREFRKHRIAINVTRFGSQTIVSLDDMDPLVARGAESDVEKSTMVFEIRLSRLGISLIRDMPSPRELLYAHLDLIRLEMIKTSETDNKTIRFVISDIQVDCQLPDRAGSATSATQHEEGEGAVARPAVVLANRGRGDRMFLKLAMEQSATSSADIMIQRLDIAMDELDIALDDHWVDAVVAFARQCRSGHGNGLRLSSCRSLAGKSILTNYEPPPLPSVVQVERLRIDKIRLTLWCALKLKSCGFLPAWVRDALRVLSFSNELTLEDATLGLPAREVPLHRGSLRDFLRTLLSEYTLNLVNNAGVALGKSSVLNLPRVPLRLGGNTVSFLSDTMGLVAGEAASLINHLTFDEEYVNRQREMRKKKQIHDFADGMHEAGRSLGQGIEGVFDVVRKPAEGWRENGLQGAVVGMGQGITSGVAKPLSNLGQAISDMGAGISAAVGSRAQDKQRIYLRPRLRRPRLLFAEGGAIRPWSEVHAEMLYQFGDERMRGIQEVICLHKEGPVHWILLLFAQRLELVELTMPTSSSCGRLHSASVDDAPDLLGALNASTEKIFSQAMKPITKLVTSMREFNFDGSSSESGDKYETFEFRELRQVVPPHEEEECPVLVLVDSKGLRHPLPLLCPEQGKKGQQVIEALEHGFKSALDHADSTANWDELRSALRQESRVAPPRPETEDDTKNALRDAGSITLEVFEVERWMLMANEWQVPCLPTDKDLRWRWVDSTGRKHPCLDASLDRNAAASKKVPPCELESLFQKSGDWMVSLSDQTDSNGWSYGLSWRASTWEPKPGLFDHLRRRKWTSVYK